MSLPTNREDLQGYHDALARDIYDQVKRRERLLAEAEEYKRKAAEYEKRANELLRRGFGGDYGTIAEARVKLAAAARMLADFDKPLVYWTRFDGKDQPESTAFPEGRYEQVLDDPYVVEKITAKRIFVRKKGDSKLHQYERSDGMNVGRWRPDTIDITKTFPEGLPS